MEGGRGGKAGAKDNPSHPYTPFTQTHLCSFGDPEFWLGLLRTMFMVRITKYYWTHYYCTYLPHRKVPHITPLNTITQKIPKMILNDPLFWVGQLWGMFTDFLMNELENKALWKPAFNWVLFFSCWHVLKSSFWIHFQGICQELIPKKNFHGLTSPFICLISCPLHSVEKQENHLHRKKYLIKSTLF